jgi:hypothetical protein
MTSTWMVLRSGQTVKSGHSCPDVVSVDGALVELSQSSMVSCISCHVNRLLHRTSTRRRLPLPFVTLLCVKRHYIDEYKINRLQHPYVVE